MKSLGAQFEEKMAPRVTQEKMSTAIQKMALEMEEDSRDRSKRGEPLPNGRWNNTYGRTQRWKKGRSSPVDLRDTRASMKGMRTQKLDRGAAIQGSQKLRWHDTGTAKGGKIRQLFPKDVTQIPRRVMSSFLKHVTKILKGYGTN